MRCATLVGDGPENSFGDSTKRSEGVTMGGGKGQTLEECASTLYEPYIWQPNHVRIARCED